ncbi:MAG TPA: Uma2 family endonuclease [Bryobacteraceae bacterium]|jgi:Uma2 family endonuclease
MATVVAQNLTYEEWLKMPPVEDGTDEVVNGELRFMAPTRQPHAEIIRRLIRALDRQLDDTRSVAFGSNLGLMISRDPLTCRSPDIVVYWREKMVIQDGLHWSAPDLIVEILSPSENRRRKEEKLADYSAIGVPEVWLVSPEAETIELRLLKEGKLERVAILADGSLQPSQFAGVSISVPSLFPD